MPCSLPTQPLPQTPAGPSDRSPFWPGFPERSGFLPILNFLLPPPQVPLMTGQPGPGHGKKLGHRGVDASGETTYKKVPALPSVNGGGTRRGPRHVHGAHGRSGVGHLWLEAAPPAAPQVTVALTVTLGERKLQLPPVPWERGGVEVGPGLCAVSWPHCCWSSPPGRISQKHPPH